jgi:hypothetical protein
VDYDERWLVWLPIGQASEVKQPRADDVAADLMIVLPTAANRATADAYHSVQACQDAPVLMIGDATQRDLFIDCAYLATPYRVQDLLAAMLLNTRKLGDGATSLGVVRRTHVRKDGTAIEVRISAALIQYGGRTAFQDIVRDETDRIRMETSLSKQVTRVSELNTSLRREVKERKTAAKRLRLLSLMDELTQIANRRAFDRRFELE